MLRYSCKSRYWLFLVKPRGSRARNKWSLVFKGTIGVGIWIGIAGIYFLSVLKQTKFYYISD